MLMKPGEVCSMKVELDRGGFLEDGGRLKLQVMLKDSAGGNIFRSFQVDVGKWPTDPLEAWEFFTRSVAGFTAQPVDTDPGIPDMTRRVPSTAIRLRRAMVLDDEPVGVKR